MNHEKWRNRPLTVRVLELCPECNVLKEDVKKREARLYGYGKSFTVLACLNCFTDVKRRREAEMYEGVCLS